MAAQMPVRAVGRIVGEHDTRLWRIVKHYVDEARAAADHGGVQAVGVDEKACRRGHSYVTFFADLDKRRLLYATQGRKWGVLGESRADLEAPRGKWEWHPGAMHGHVGGVRRRPTGSSSRSRSSGTFPRSSLDLHRFHGRLVFVADGV